jgi:hypothetical protein
MTRGHGCPARRSRTTKCTSTSNTATSSRQVAAAAKAGISERSARRIEGGETPCRRSAGARLANPQRPAGRRLGRRGRAAAAQRPLAERRDAARGTAAPPPRALRHRRAAHPAAAHAPVARRARRRARRLLRAGASAGPPGAVGLHRLRRPGRQIGGAAVPAPAVPVRAGALGLAPCRWSPAARASWRCPPGCRRPCGAWAACPRSTAPTACRRPSTTWPSRGAHAPLRRSVPSLRHAREPLQPGQSHENGAIESRHDSLKTALDQALRLRGTRSLR